MLEIQKFMYRHPDDWKELLSAAPYNLKISIDGEYVLFKYSQIDSDFNEPICREARGLIIYLPRMEVVRFAFEKFFNLGESFADTLDWSTATSGEKIDGSIMSLWFYMGEWHVSTNGVINAYNAPLSDIGPYKNFGSLFDAAAKNVGLDYNTLDEELMYTFELTSKFNKVVIPYDEPNLHLLSVRSCRTLEEIYPIPSTICPTVPRPEMYELNSKEDYAKLVSSMGADHEGIVVRDAAGHRVKMKTLSYFELHHAINNHCLTLERVVKLIRANDHAELLSYFSEYQNLFDFVEAQINEAYIKAESIKSNVATWKASHPSSTRGEFAQYVSEIGDVPQLYFLAYDGNLDASVEEMTDKKFINTFKIKEM